MPDGKGARFGSTKEGGVCLPFGGGWGPPPPLQPPKQSHTPRGHTLAGGGPRDNSPGLVCAWSVWHEQLQLCGRACSFLGFFWVQGGSPPLPLLCTTLGYVCCMRHRTSFSFHIHVKCSGHSTPESCLTKVIPNRWHLVVDWLLEGRVAGGASGQSQNWSGGEDQQRTGEWGGALSTVRAASTLQLFVRVAVLETHTL